jgi:hypothetical protein
VALGLAHKTVDHLGERRRAARVKRGRGGRRTDCR